MGEIIFTLKWTNSPAAVQQFHMSGGIQSPPIVGLWAGEGKSALIQTLRVRVRDGGRRVYPKPPPPFIGVPTWGKLLVDFGIYG